MKLTEIFLGGTLFALFLVHILGLLDQSMMFSGFLVTLTCLYIAIIWQEKTLDERDEYIRAKTDRYLYLLTLSVLILSIIYKTFSHENYLYELILVAILSIGKLVISKVLREKH